MYSVRRLHLTLVEMLIVIMVLMLVSGVAGINITRAVKEQQFRTEVDLMVDTLRLAQDLMLILDTDTYVRIKARQDKKGIEYWLDVKRKIPKQWESVISHSRRFLKETHGVFFLEQQPFPVVDGELTIYFQSGGSMMSRGVLYMSTHEKEDDPGAMKRAIYLYGYPHSITSIPKKDKSIDYAEEKSQEFNNRLTQYTTEEIQEDDAIKKRTTSPTRSGEEKKNPS